MKGSGKQVLNQLLAELSTKLINDEDLPLATKRLRAGLLLHGSTSEENYELVSKLVWSSLHEDGNLIKQGIATKKGNIFISDLFESMIDTPGLKDSMLKEYSALNPNDYEASIFAMWLLISSVQMFAELLTIEKEDDIDLEEWVNSMARHYDHWKNNKANV